MSHAPRSRRRHTLPQPAPGRPPQDLQEVRALYPKRQQSIEAVLGQAKDGRRIRGFLRRGKTAAASGWKLIHWIPNPLKPYPRVPSDTGAAPCNRVTSAPDR